MKGFFIDVQGTLIDDKNFLPLPGSIEFLDYLNENNIPFALIIHIPKINVTFIFDGKDGEKKRKRCGKGKVNFKIGFGITIISDDLKGDLIPAKKLGMKTALVLSGKIKSEKEITKRVDFVFKDIKEYYYTIFKSMHFIKS